MTNTRLPFVILVVVFVSLASFAQSTVVINTPGEEPVKVELTSTEQRIMDRNVLPKARKRLAGDACEEELNVAGKISGAFSKAGTNQTLIFYQFCQTGNGLGASGVVLIEGGRVVGNFVSEESGWTVDAKTLPDINENGLNEIVFYYSGGMHQGAGGTGADIMEFSGGKLKGLGWFQAESFSESSPVTGYKITVKPGPTPTFYREKYVANSAGRWRKTGKIQPLKLTETFGKFEVLK